MLNSSGWRMLWPSLQYEELTDSLGFALSSLVLAWTLVSQSLLSFLGSPLIPWVSLYFLWGEVPRCLGTWHFGRHLEAQIDNLYLHACRMLSCPLTTLLLFLRLAWSYWLVMSRVLEPSRRTFLDVLKTISTFGGDDKSSFLFVLFRSVKEMKDNWGVLKLGDTRRWGDINLIL